MPCLAIELLKAKNVDKAFDLLWELQNLFFVRGLNINKTPLLEGLLSNYGITKEQATLGMGQSKIK
tara:strand:- start:734 stop:931 length:198 start_codon:yes stop_codon:yes gene_type:complete